MSGFRRDSASALVVAVMVLGVTALGVGAGVLVVNGQADVPSTAWKWAGWALIGGGAIVLLFALALLIILAFEHRGRDVKFNFPIRWPIHFDKKDTKPDPLTSETIKEIVRAAIVEAQQQSPAAASVAAKPALPPPTGDTVVGQILKMQNVGFHFWKTIDFHAGAEYLRWERLNGLLKLPLGEVALLRRLAVAPNGSDDRPKCETALGATGMADATGALYHLQGLGLVQFADGNLVSITEAGRECVYAFNQWLVHRWELVAAYRPIARLINKKVRFDGGEPG